MSVGVIWGKVEEFVAVFFCSWRKQSVILRILIIANEQKANESERI